MDGISRIKEELEYERKDQHSTVSILEKEISYVHEGNKPHMSDTSNFLTKSYLKRHIETVNEDKNPFHCNICFTNFSFNLSVATEVQIVYLITGKMASNQSNFR